MVFASNCRSLVSFVLTLLANTYPTHTVSFSRQAHNVITVSVFAFTDGARRPIQHGPPTVVKPHGNAIGLRVMCGRSVWCVSTRAHVCTRTPSAMGWHVNSLWTDFLLPGLQSPYLNRSFPIHCHAHVVHEEASVGLLAFGCTRCHPHPNSSQASFNFFSIGFFT